MSNTGNKQYALLVQYSASTGLPTGVVKPNVPGDPDYVAPVVDAAGCPFIPITDTHFTINNWTKAPRDGYVDYLVNTGVNEGRVEIGETTSFTESGGDHKISFESTRIGDYNENGTLTEPVAFDAFCFMDGVLVGARASGGRESDFSFTGLSGEVVINVTTNFRGYYGSAYVGAFQTGPDFGNAYFEISFQFQEGGPVVLDKNSQFTAVDFRNYELPVVLRGQNNNPYPLLMTYTLNDGEWIPVDPDDLDNTEWILIPEVVTETIAPGESYERAYSNMRDDIDFFVTLTKA
ncbi:hypothetical protein [Chitinophaga sp. Cy-1792]|uniref:hypothetical protein n=1 Tax=Chitinophaga sp. Cy-1792 TaxID=2608339 RepID=UPI001421C66D|nr:hypothetical protein [Chitinophaga sp. Cy-1792]NIG54749.1 hypothetical protein [Chitinophaga sp. Cy-1792]